MADGSGSSCGTIDQALSALSGFAGNDRKAQAALKVVDNTFRKMARKANGLEAQAWQLGALKDRLQASLGNQLSTTRLGVQLGVGVVGGVGLHTMSRKICGAITRASPTDEGLGFFRRPSTHIAAIDMAVGASWLIGGAVYHSRARAAADSSADPYLAHGAMGIGSTMLALGINTLAERYI